MEGLDRQSGTLCQKSVVPALCSDPKEWKLIPNYPAYEVSQEGNVRIMKTQRIMTANTNANGYLYVKLVNEEGRKTFKIHRLLASLFIENPSNHPIVDHINRVKTDNALKNLRWCSHQQNLMNRLPAKHGVRQRGKKWEAIMIFNGRRMYLGRYDTQETAQYVYKHVNKALCQEFSPFY